MNVLIRFFIFFVLSLDCVYAKTLEFYSQCGHYKYIAVVENPEDLDGEIIKLFFQKPNEIKQLFYQTQNKLVDAECIKDKNGSDLLIFRESCSGSACIETIYGLYSPRQEKFLLIPKDWPQGNEDEVINILGFKPELFDLDSDKSFCCISQVADYRYKQDKNN